MTITKILEFHARIMKIMKKLKIISDNNETNKNHRILLENRENHEKCKSELENHENHEILKYQKRIMKIMKIENH